MAIEEYSDPLALDRVRREGRDEGLDDLLCVGLAVVGGSAGSLWAAHDGRRPELISVIAAGADPEDSVAADRVAVVRQILNGARSVELRLRDGRFALATPIHDGVDRLAVAVLEAEGEAPSARPAFHIWKRALGAYLASEARIDRLRSEGHTGAAIFHEAVLRSAPIGVAVGRIRIGGDVEFRFWNDEMLRITGYDLDEVNQRGWSRLAFGGEQASRGRAFVERAMGGHRVVQTHVQMTARDGTERHLQLFGWQLASAGGQHFLCAAIDRTEQGQFEGRLREAQRADSLGLIAAGVANDLNDLLTRILGYANLLELDGAEAKTFGECAAEIREAAHQAVGVGRQIAAISGRTEFAVEPVSWTHLVQDAMRVIASGGRRTLRIDVNLATDSGVVLADRTQMQQVLMQLAGNAVEAIDEGGSIRLRAFTADLSAGDLSKWTLPLQAEPGQVSILEVWNDGEMIPEELRERVFDASYSTKAAGRGLGLAAVRGIVNSGRGAIDVRSSNATGTTIQVALPVASPDQVRGLVASTRPDPVPESPDGKG